MGKIYVTLLFLMASAFSFAQTINGTVIEKATGEPVVGASVVEVGTKNGTTTDLDGKFELRLSTGLPAQIEVSFIGLKKQVVPVRNLNSPIKVLMDPDSEVLAEVNVVEQRLSDKQKESALTVEAMDALAVKETPAVSFYEGLGHLKGVDLTSASLAFKVINTRGFNSTSPVRSLQIIDGVDNQAPGLNFSLGNFLGASDLDVANVDIIAGASSAFYGPGAFNGVISMTTKDPFLFPGLSVSQKVGERALSETAVRWAHVLKDKEGNEKFAYKINIFYLRANDWEADNLDPTDQSTVGRENPGGYDAVNRYGDETQMGDGGDVRTYAGVGTFHRTGINEVDLVDYDTENLKFSTSLHYKIKPDLQLIYGFNFGYGTTVYQGDNRYSLKDIRFFQNKLELRKENKFYVRAYATNENAGNSYDAYFTALKMQDTYLNDQGYENLYRTLWNVFYVPQVKNLPGYPDDSPTNENFEEELNQLIIDNLDQFQIWHAENRSRVDNSNGGPALQPGTSQFDSLFSYITTRTFNEGGSRFFDKSALYHVMGAYDFDENSWGKFTVGGNGRLYVPNSNGTIFSDTNGRQITNYEYGVFGGWEKKFFYDRVKVNATLRVDKNQNFDYLFSPAASFIYQIDELNTLRFSFSSAIRNPTLQDQYLYYNVGRAILLGNITGYDSLVTIDDVEKFLGGTTDERRNYKFDYFTINPIKPERVRTVEAGYRTTLFEKLFVDMNYYFSWYQDFIGFQIALDIEDDPSKGPSDRFSGAQAYRISSNARDQVTTQGFNIGLNYYFANHYTLSGNYSWNVLNTATDDPIIPAFNTPEHKYNLGINGRNIYFQGWDWKGFGFSVNYKWVQGFLFEGSPQFTGRINDYDMLDAQVSQRIEKWDLTLKLGASNLLNNKVYQVYGGPRVGRLAYFSILYENF